MVSLLIFVVVFPKEYVYGKIVPSFGLAIFAASCCYFIFERMLSKETGRLDVTALPSGPSAPSIFTVTFWSFCQFTKLLGRDFPSKFLRKVGIEGFSVKNDNF
ncbi:hypothetical protein [Neobacillus massiliamazoniensis]|uniref:hypothetical protein n=1 Tax=Neobacillus massiliamazoniensis TaxID=1499688 RepID=UPI000A8347A8|nr:hypothetical protein [Neobacillus massiliamazoniensis]